ncbi:11987_t:CDS:2 [Diversispora eburnea]|uniref:11987_t:CDS:1 n=1 Tax=Diversispora eburnea TaxID=1213867 RepID=A0A9N9FQQ4_9GLOM|nr:11987_t:CDS:2 [Diversispora eburnea]
MLAADKSIAKIMCEMRNVEEDVGNGRSSEDGEIDVCINKFIMKICR